MEDNKLPYIIGIGVVALIIATYLGYFSFVAPGSIVSTSEVNVDGITYIKLNINHDPFTSEDVGFVDSIATKDIDIDGAVTSDNKIVEGNMRVKLEVKAHDLGFGAPVNDFQETYINKAWLEGTIFKTVKTETGTIKYYQVVDDIRPLASYTVYATVNGEKYQETITGDKYGKIHEITGTDPVIYWQDSSLGLTPDTRLISGIYNIDIYKEGSGVSFAKRDATKEMAECWNAIFEDDYYAISDNGNYWFDVNLFKFGDIVTYPDGYVSDKVNRRVDLNGDDTYDITSTKRSFSNSQFLHNSYRFRTSDFTSAPLQDQDLYLWLPFPDTERAPFAYNKETAGYYIATKNDETMLRKDSTLTIKGVWLIPAEYGDVVETTHNPIPEIVGTPEISETMYAGLTTAIISIDVKNIGETGPITVRITSNAEDTSITIPDPQIVTIAADKTHTFLFDIKADRETIEENIIITASGKTTSITKDVSITILGAPTETDTKYRIIITAINKDGTTLGSDFPITVSQNSVTRYGVWVGDLLPTKTKIYGEETIHNNVVYYPEDFYHTPDKDESLNFVYTTEPPKTTETPWYYYLIGGTLAILVLMFAWRKLNE